MTDRQRSAALARIRPYVDRARNFSGWDLSGVRVNDVDEGPSWDYDAVARDHALRAKRVLDLGTGGGEVLSRVIGSPRRGAVATEEWVVNAPVARARLAPVGVNVVRCSSLALPLRDATFELVLSRHEAIAPAEVVRVLRRGGRFITQQVGPDNWPELRKHFPRKRRHEDHLTRYQRELSEGGLTVSARQHEWRAAFETLGNLAYMLTVAVDVIPDFEAEADIDALLAVERDCGRADGSIVLTETRYLMVADKPPAGS